MAAASASLLPRIPKSSAFASSSWLRAYTARLTKQAPLLKLSITLPGVSLNIPGWIGDIWESVLRAVPKKKTSHSKKRHRQMAGKALKDVNSLCKCPACGRTKRMHRICSHCLAEIKEMWKKDFPKDFPEDPAL